MKKIIIVGNGFDIAHKLKTTFKNFADYYENNSVLQDFHELVDEIDKKVPIYDQNGNIKDITWYSFEENIERIAYSIHQKNFLDDFTQEQYDCIESVMEKINDLFNNLSKLLLHYLELEYKRKECSLEKIESVEKEITNDSYIITFNYTDTVKLYTNNCYYIHGSIKENYIVLGFANGEVPDSSTTQYKKYWKEVIKERLKFIRYLNQKKYNVEKGLLNEFERHLDCLFSGKGGYAFPSYYDERLEKETYDIRNSFNIIAEYAKCKDFSLGIEEERGKLKEDYKNVEEIVIMGHGLEADKYYIKSIFEIVPKLKVVKLYSFAGEKEADIERKVKILKDYSGLKNIEICYYTR